MKRKLLFAIVALFCSIGSWAYTTSDLTNSGWTKVTSLSSVDNYYYVLVDAASSDYAMGRLSYGGDRPVYMPLADPLGFAGAVWYLGQDGDNYTIKNLGDNKFFISGTAGWNDSMNENQYDDEGRFTFTLNNGKYDIKSVKTGSYVGPWNNDNKVTLSDGYENVAANKGADQAPGFYLYAMLRTEYNAKRITASWLASHGWSEVTDNAQLGNTSNYYLIVESVSMGYALARTSNGRPASKSLSNPFTTLSLLWQTETSGSGYKLQSAVDGKYFSSAAGDWNTGMGNHNADIIATLADGVYTLSAGGTSNIGHWRDSQLFPYENESVAANKNETNRNSYHIYTISKADYATQKASLISTAAAAATEAAPANLSEYIFNNSDFAVLDKFGWTLSGSAGNQQAWNGSFETWNSSDASITQDLANMPRGKYKLTVQMVSGDAGRVPYLYANGDDEYTANVSQQATANSYDGMKGEIAADVNYGLLTVNPHLSADGTLTVGVKAPSGWVVFDNFKLYYYGKTIKSEAAALPGNGDMEAGKWYYFDIAAAADNYNATATTLGDIVFTTDAMTLIENQSSVTANFNETDNSLSATRYYVKSSSDNNLVVEAASFTYEVGTPIQSIADGAYVNNNDFSTITFNFSEASSNDPGTSFAILNNTAKASLKKGGVEQAQGTLSLDGKVLTATFSTTLDLSSTYTIEIESGVVGYEGQVSNAAINTTIHTGAITNGVYYFKKNDADVYITRGGWYGTEAVVDYFGLSFEATIQTNGKYYLKNVDHSLSANSSVYLNGEGSTYTDSGNPFGWTIEATEGGYYLRPSDTQYMIATYQGEYPYSYMSKTTDAAAAYVWNILTKAEYATALTSAKNAQTAAIATAAGKSAANVAELEALLASDFGATDVTSSIQGAALKTSDDMANWTQVKYNGKTFKDADANGVCAEIWNSTGGVYQAITSLPEGIYKVTLHATWRPGALDQGNRVGNEINTTAWIYANTESETNNTQLVNWYSTDNTVNSRQQFVDAGEKFVNTTYVYVAEGETLTLGIASPSYCSGAWLPFYGWTLTYYEAKATAEQKAALASAIEAAENRTLGFETGEYAPYNNIDALETVAAAKAIDTETASGASVLAAIAALNTADWTANVSKQNAFYDGTFAAQAPKNDGSSGTKVKGWTDNSSLRTLPNSEDENAALYKATAGHSGMYVWNNANVVYGETAGYTVPLHANQVYSLSYKRGSWNSDGNSTYGSVSIAGPEETTIPTVEESKYAYQYQSTAGELAQQTFYFVAPVAGNYVITVNCYGNTVFTDFQLYSVDANELTFADDAAIPTYVPGTYPSVTVNRAVKASYNTLVLPFALTAEQVEDAFGEGTKVYTFSEESADANAVTVNFNEGDGSISANVPVLVKATSASASQTFANVPVVATAEAKVSGTNVDFVGTYAAMTVAEGDYFIGNGALYKSAGSTSMKAFRAYLQCKEANAEVKMFIDDVETGISSIDNGQLTMDNAKIYNLAGQRVSKAQKGLYIVNGKKILVK